MPIKLRKGTFVRDDSDSDHGLEALLDFEISWILRICANKEEEQKHPRLFHQCITILKKLLELRETEFTVKSVRVWKQWERIDICAEILVESEGKEQWHILAIEDKAYTMMRENQRDSYPDAIKEYYNKKEEFEGYKLNLCVISLFSNTDDNEKPYFIALKDFATAGKKYKWKVFSIDELPDYDADNVTESDIFNEFWLVNW